VLQKAKTECVVNLEERPNNRLSQFFFDELEGGHASRCGRSLRTRASKQHRQDHFIRGNQLNQRKSA
jgi:hypothetical protein